MGVLPLGTGNDLSQVLGWGSICDDDSLVPQIIERYQSATTKMLDRWSIQVSPSDFKKHPVKILDLPKPESDQINDFEEKIGSE